MTNEEIGKIASRLGRLIREKANLSMFETRATIEVLKPELASLVSQAYEDAERAVFDEHCRCDVTYLSGKEHRADCPVRCIRALKASLVQEPVAST